MAVNEVVENMVELAPGGSERAEVGEVGREDRVEERKARSEDSSVGLGKEDTNPPAEWGQVVAVGASACAKLRA